MKKKLKTVDHQLKTMASPGGAALTGLHSGRGSASVPSKNKDDHDNTGARPKDTTSLNISTRGQHSVITSQIVSPAKMVNPTDARGKSKVVELKSLKHGILLETFDFKQDMKLQYKDYDIEVKLGDDVSQIEIHGESLDNVDWLERSHQFIDSLSSTVIDTNNNVDKLLIDDDNNPIKTVHTFINDKLNEVYGKKYSFVLFREDACLRMYCKDKHSAHTVKRMIENCFRTLSAVKICSPAGQELVKDAEKARKLFIEKKEDNSCNITGTVDVIEKLKNNQHVKYVKVASLPKLITEYLNMYGKMVLENVCKKLDVEYELLDSSVIFFARKPEQLKQAQAELRCAIKELRKSIKFPIDDLTDKHRTDLDDAMKSLQCCWKIQPITKPEKMLQNCKYVTYWYDVIDDLRVCVVRGNPWNIDLDLQIILTTNHLFPYMDLDFKTNEAVDRFIDHGKKLVEEKFVPLPLGFTSDFYDDVKIDLSEHKTHVVGVVACSDDGSKRQFIKSDTLKRVYSSIFQKAISKNIKTVGIFAKVDGNKSTTNVSYIKEFVNVILRRNSKGNNKLSHITECVLCCMENHNLVIDELGTLFEDQSGYCQKNCTSDEKLSGNDVGKNATEILVKNSQLQDEIADALVNTTNKELNLSKGLVSRNILKLAGPELEEQCKQRYPNGLTPGQIAVTDSFGLKGKKKSCKHIYHIALPPYKYDTFRKDIMMYVKKCLCQAERDKCEKIAFPAFGVGSLTYPRREVAEAMISAADEYRNEAINFNLRKIKFTVVKEDKETTEAFSCEEWRRSKKCLEKLKLDRFAPQEDFTALNVHCDHMLIKITTGRDYGCPPSYAVCCYFKNFKTKNGPLKRASNEPYTWNDYLYFGTIIDVKSTQEILTKNHEIMKSERITLAIIYTSNNINEPQQVKEVVEYFHKTDSLPKLKTVIIIVSNENELHKTGKLLKLDVTQPSRIANSTIELVGDPESLVKADNYLQEFIKTARLRNTSHLYKEDHHAVAKIKTDGATSLNAGNDKNSRTTKNNNADVQMKSSSVSYKNGNPYTKPHNSLQTSNDVLAESKKKRNAGANNNDDNKQISDIVTSAIKNIDRETSDDDPTIGCSDDSLVVGCSDDNDDACIFECPNWDDDDSLNEDTVRAQLNHGIVEMNKTNSYWKKWVNQIYKDYDVKIVVSNVDENECFVYGSLDKIMKFEAYLENMVNGCQVTTVEQDGNKETTFF